MGNFLVICFIFRPAKTIAMKKTSLILALLVLLMINAYAQKIQAYDAVVNLKNSVIEKGILYDVVKEGLILQRGDSLVSISTNGIAMLKIYAAKSPYKFKKIFTYDPWDESNFETKSSNMVRIRKWNEEDPTPGEEIKGYISTAVVNGAIHLIALPISAIRANIFKVSINCKTDKFDKVKEELSYYSINYQAHDSGAELKKISLNIKDFSAN